jgi:hypothetical protein
MDQSRSTLDAAHRRSTDHRNELERSEVCGCFYCLATFVAADVEEWIDDDGTALCPRCGVDSVLGSASGYPAGDRRFLEAMHARWFG